MQCKRKIQNWVETTETESEQSTKTINKVWFSENINQVEYSGKIEEIKFSIRNKNTKMIIRTYYEQFKNADKYDTAFSKSLLSKTLC